MGTNASNTPTLFLDQRNQLSRAVVLGPVEGGLAGRVAVADRSGRAGIKKLLANLEVDLFAMSCGEAGDERRRHAIPSGRSH